MSSIIFALFSEYGACMIMKERVKQLCKEKGVSMNTAESEMGLAKGYISKLGKSNPNQKTLQKMSDYFGVPVTYLMYGDRDEKEKLSTQNKRDVAKNLDEILEAIDSDDGLMFDGAAFDEETKEYLKNSISVSLTNAKIMAKEKYTPKKYRNLEE